MLLILFSAPKLKLIIGIENFHLADRIDREKIIHL